VSTIVQVRVASEERMATKIYKDETTRESFLQFMDQMRKEEKMCDLRILCDSCDVFKVHKVLLVSYFGSEKIKVDCTEDELKINLSVDIVYKIIEFCYKGTIEIEVGNCLAIREAIAEFGGNVELTKFVDNFIRDNGKSILKELHKNTSKIRALHLHNLMENIDLNHELSSMIQQCLFKWWEVDPQTRGEQYLTLTHQFNNLKAQNEVSASTSSGNQSFF
jgi:hypothetical protein